MNETCGTWPRALAGGISSSSGQKILGNARKLSIIGLYSVWEGGLVVSWGRPVGWTWRWSSVKLGSRQVPALKLWVELRTIGFAELQTLIKCKNQP